MTQSYINDAEGPCHCDNCDWKGDASHLEMISDIEQRLSAGGVVPAGQCPREDCGALAYLDKVPGWARSTGPAKPIKLPTLAIILEGGLVQCVVSDQAARVAAMVDDIVVIDYDTEGADEDEISMVRQERTGKPGDPDDWADALVHSESIHQARIGLLEIKRPGDPESDEPNPDPDYDDQGNLRCGNGGEG